jgi:hypothetical protein
MPALVAWLLPVLFVTGCVSMAYWLLGLISEARAHPERTFFKMRGINPFGGARALIQLAAIPRKRYVRAGWFWLVYFAAWAGSALSMSFWFMLPMVLLMSLVAAWVLFSLLEERRLQREIAERAREGDADVAG